MMSVKSKNIHVLPTDKPSKLFYNVGGALLFTNYENHNGVNIYITSDEEIKEGDWFYNTIYLNPEVFKACENGHGYVNCSKYSHNRRDCKKIILTDNQDLIKDGVQAIGDEFLEWFVKNPSCEYVGTEIVEFGFDEVPICTYEITIPEKITRCCGRCNGVDDLCYSDMTCDNHKERGCEICYGKKVEYKIIIPKEEPKQETLEEALSRFKEEHTVLNLYPSNILQNIAEFGAKWQQEQIGNSEFLQKLRATISDAEARRLIFEQFKNK